MAFGLLTNSLLTGVDWMLTRLKRDVLGTKIIVKNILLHLAARKVPEVPTQRHNMAVILQVRMVILCAPSL